MRSSQCRWGWLGIGLGVGVWASGCNQLLEISSHGVVELDGGRNDSGGVIADSRDTSAGAAPSTAMSHLPLHPADAGNELMHADGADSQGGSASSWRDGGPSAVFSGAADASIDPASSTTAAVPSATAEPSIEPAPSATPIDPRTIEPPPPEAGAAEGCLASTTSGIPSTHCHFINNGHDGNDFGAVLPHVGETDVWVYWSGTSVAGWICVNDNEPNSRGINFHVVLHASGTASDLPTGGFIPNSAAFTEVHSGRDLWQMCHWESFSGTLSTDVDAVVVEWEDRWESSADGSPQSQFGGRYTISAT